MDADALIERLWRDYVAITPQVEPIHALLAGRGERFGNDHIALRTFEGPRTGLEALARPFERRGWSATGDYRFEHKRLRARSYSHAREDLPRVFISELCTAQFDEPVPGLVHGLLAQIETDASPLDLLLRRPTWPPVPYATYRSLLERSEYAAWLSAFGIRVNHFTVSVNDLSTFDGLDDLNEALRAAGFALNGTGRQIQGSPDVGLEQSSTVASPIPWTFAGGEQHTIPSCYYEFALRHRDPNTDRLYDGFVTSSADKIFESTDVRRG